MQEKPPKKKSKFFKVAKITLFSLAIFMLGWFLGGGRFRYIGLSNQNGDLPNKLNYSSVNQVYDVLRKTYDGKLTQEQLLDGLKKGLADSTGDPYTEYLNADESKEFDNELNGTFSGIGAELSREGDQLIVVAPLAGFPAEKAGLKSQDVITDIDGEPTYDMSLTEAVDKIRGPVGTDVTLSILRKNEGAKDIKITRQDITVPSVEYEVKNGIGYMTISRFSDDTALLSLKAAKEFNKQQVKGVVLDLRNNPGGLLDASVDVASLWLNAGDTVLTERRGGEVTKTYKANGDDFLKGIPTVVLINEGSASASEIVAGALKDNNVATVVGTKSFGKGSVQGLEPITSGGVLKVTIARWYTPGDRNIDKEGISPDKKVELTAKDVKNNNDSQLSAAENILN